VMDRVVFSEPVNELEPVFVEVRMPASVSVPEMEAVPPTSRVVLVAPPALIPSLLAPVISKLVDTETPPLKVLSAVQMLAVALDAGPVTQSSFTKPAEAVLETSNMPASKEMEVILTWDVGETPKSRPEKLEPLPA